MIVRNGILFFLYIEAYTTSHASGSSGTKITDEGFTYTARGELSDTYELTPHSGGYYHIPVTYWPNGQIATLGGLSTLGQISFGIDGEGRPNSVNYGGNSILNNVVFNVSSQITSMTVGFGPTEANPAWVYDPQTGRLKSPNAGLNNATYSNTLSWNANGSLQQLQVSDSGNTADAQTCTYSADDLGRIASANCGSIWSQTFSYDPFGNVSSSGTYSWQPGYNSSTNQYALGGTSYDLSGNLLNDTFYSYTWDAEEKVISAYRSPHTFAFVYDALGRIVEYQEDGAAWGELARFGSYSILMNGQALGQGVEIPLIGGITFKPLSNGNLSEFRIADWLGSPRVNFAYTGNYTKSLAYSPFGEPYAENSAAGGEFTNQPNSLCWACTDFRVEYDFPARELNPVQGRWISPDPAGLGAVDLLRPQSWNRYGYVVNNPLRLVDPLGFGGCPPGDPNCIEVTATAPPPVTLLSSTLTSMIAGSFDYGRALHFILAALHSNAGSKCVHANTAQRTLIKIMTKVANWSNDTIGYGFGVSYGLGFGQGFGFSGTGSAQLQVSPGGNASLVYTFGGSGLTQDWLTPSSFGASFIIGPQISVSNAPPSSGPGADVAVSAVLSRTGVGPGIGVDINGADEGVTGTLTGGLGLGLASGGATVTRTIAVPLCKD